MPLRHAVAIFHACLLIVLAIVGGAAQPAAPAPLKNPGFEAPFAPFASVSDTPGRKAVIRGSLPRDWSDNSDWADVTVDYSQETQAPHGGQSALRVRVGSVRAGAVQIVQPVALRKGGQYAFRVWLKGANGTQVRLLLRQAAAPYKVYAERSFLMSGGWKECEVVGSVDADADAFAMIATSGPGDFTVDDASLDDLTTKVSDAPPLRGNLLPNASFEAGPQGGLPQPYRGGGWSVRSEGAGIPPLGSRTESLDVRAYRDTQSPAAVGVSSLKMTILPGRNVRLASPPLTFNFGRPHTLSVYLRSDTPGVSVYLALHKDGQARGLERTCQVGPKWERFTVSGTPGYTSLPVVIVRAENAPEDARPITLWVDGVQLEEAPKASAGYLPPYPYEMRVTCDAPGHVFFDSEKAFLEVNVGGGGNPEVSAPRGALAPKQAGPMGLLRVSLLDVTQQVRKTFSLSLPLGETRGPNNPRAVRLPDAVSRRPLGIFKARMELFTLDGKTRLAAPSECVYARLPRPRAIEPARSYFGVHIPLARDFARIAVATGNRWTRLHDTSMSAKWATAEHEPERYEFFDAGVDTVIQSGMTVLGMLDGAPAWTTTQPRSGYWGFWNIPDKPVALDAWRRYVRANVAHYKGKINAWEVWNEPWGEWWLTSGNPNATPDRYGELLRIAFEETRAANPDALLVGIDTYFGGHNETWTGPALRAAGPAFFDVFSFHRYDPSLFGGAEPVATVETNFYREAQRAVGGPVRPLWNTEGGPGGVGSFYLPDAGGLPTGLQATQIVRFDVTQRAAGVEKFFLYALHSDPYLGEVETRLIEYDRAVSPYLAARAVLASLTDGSGPPTRSEMAPGVDAYTYPPQMGGLPDGKTTLSVVWAFDGETHLVRIPPKTQVRDVWGNRLSVRGTVPVGMEPVYFLK